MLSANCTGQQQSYLMLTFADSQVTYQIRPSRSYGLPIARSGLPATRRAPASERSA